MRNIQIAIVALFTMFLTSCGSGLDGTYKYEDGTDEKYELVVNVNDGILTVKDDVPAVEGMYAEYVFYLVDGKYVYQHTIYHNPDGTTKKDTFWKGDHIIFEGTNLFWFSDDRVTLHTKI